MSRLLIRFLKHPRQIGSIASSSRWLAQAIAVQADASGPILELGAGTGPITAELLKKTPQIDVVEIDATLATHLRQQFPTLTIHERDIEDVLRATGPWRTIVSGIPFAVMPKAKRDRVFHLIHETLEYNGRFVIFQYSKTTEKELRDLYGQVNVTTLFVPWNIPPAFVFTCIKR